MKKGFKILPVNPYENKDKTIKEYYYSWREFNKGNDESKETFAMLYTSFVKNGYLSRLDGGSIKLYLFFCFNANNNNGDSWYSIPKIAEYFSVQTRTVDKWIKTLVENQLIYREQTNKKSFTTYLVPYSTTLIKAQTKVTYTEDSQEIISDILNSLEKRKDIFGELVNVFHIYQWKSSKSKESIQWVLFITKRKNGVLVGHYYKLKNTDNRIVTLKPIKDTRFFNSQFKYKENPIIGIALNNEVNIQSNSYEAIKDLIEELAVVNLSDMPSEQFIEFIQAPEEE